MSTSDKSRDTESCGLHKLQMLFTRVNALPRLNESALRLMKAVDNEFATVEHLELIISSDPALATKIIRTASALLEVNYERRRLAISNAVMLMGLRSVKSVAMSLAIKTAILASPTTQLFDPRQFTRHCLFTAFAAATTYRKLKVERFPEAQWEPDEVFAAGLLYNLGVAIHFHVLEERYNFIAHAAKKHRCDFAQVFKQAYGTGLGSLASLTAEVWQLPPLFAKVMKSVDEPEPISADSLPVWCALYGRHLAETNGFPELPWEVDHAGSDDVVSAVAMDADEVPNMIETSQRQVTSFGLLAA
jgi:HD-like signal output (HDOD) protein